MTWYRLLLGLCCLTLPGWAQVPAEQLEFFEKRIRPVLVEKCYGCHSAKLAKPMGGLRLDSREGVLKGGDSGPAVKPGDPAGSMLAAALLLTAMTFVKGRGNVQYHHLPR